MCMDLLLDVTTSLVGFLVGLFCFHVWFDYLYFDPCLETTIWITLILINCCKLDLLSRVCHDRNTDLFMFTKSYSLKQIKSMNFRCNYKVYKTIFTGLDCNYSALSV